MTYKQKQSRIAACNRIMKNAKTMNKEWLNCYHIIDGIQYISDLYQLVAFKEHIDAGTEGKELKGTEKFAFYIAQAELAKGAPLDIPDANLLREYTRLYKKTVKPSDPRICLFVMGNGCCVNAEFLYNMLRIFPNTKPLGVSDMRAPIFFKDEQDNKGILLPVRKASDRIPDVYTLEKTVKQLRREISE